MATGFTTRMTGRVQGPKGGFRSAGAGSLPGVRLAEGRNLDGSIVAAAASAGKFGYAIALATSFGLVGEVATSNTKTDDVLFELILSAAYNAGSNIGVAVNAKLAGGGTPGTKTLAVLAYRTAPDGTQGANLIATAAQPIVAGGSTLAYVITGTTLLPGDRLVLRLTSVLQETAAGNVNTVINSIALS